MREIFEVSGENSGITIRNFQVPLQTMLLDAFDQALALQNARVEIRYKQGPANGKGYNIIFNTIYIFCGIILYVLVKLLCKNAMNTMVTRKTYIDNLKKHKKQCDETEYTMKEYEDLLHIVNQKVHVHKNDNPKS